MRSAVMRAAAHTVCSAVDADPQTYTHQIKIVERHQRLHTLACAGLSCRQEGTYSLHRASSTDLGFILVTLTAYVFVHAVASFACLSNLRQPKYWTGPLKRCSTSPSVQLRATESHEAALSW